MNDGRCYMYQRLYLRLLPVSLLAADVSHKITQDIFRENGPEDIFFRTYDKDSDGLLSEDELRRVKFRG